MERRYELALCQLASTEDKDFNLRKAARSVNNAAAAGSRVIALPEMWNCPYGNKYFPEYAERDGGRSCEFMSSLARDNSVYLIGGSIPETDGDRYYNTSFIYGPDGGLIAKHRKVHLFDIDVDGGPSFRESDTLSPGEGITCFDTEFGVIGVAICFDVRFTRMFAQMADAGCHLIVLPAAFTLQTGEAHWELLLRARALDNQIYFAGCAQARSDELKFKCWGHSLIADPWGDVMIMAGIDEEVIFGEIDTDYMEKVRREIPVFGH